MNWAYQNRLWYIPLHVASGTISWAWYNFSCDLELHEKFDQHLQELGYAPKDIDELKWPLTWFLEIVVLISAIIAGPLALMAVVIVGAGGFVKLRRGLKFSL
ncbi:MAG: hypothetical protein AAB792_00600 [Patescibacteria group bacterium]